MPHNSARILVIDDHEEMVNLLADQLREEGYEVDVATEGSAGISIAETNLPDVVVTDLRMKGTDGFEVLEKIKNTDEDIPVLIMTAFGAIDSAIEAMKAGAYHYITKPFQLDEMLIHINRAINERNLKAENRSLRKIAADHSSLEAIVGETKVVQELRDLVKRVAQTDAPALVRGESGTGKELVARAIHFMGPRASEPFVAVNCTSLPETLLESELFGHSKGAFTGAGTIRRGLFVEADGGSLFLDEIGDMPPELQAKLLRVIETNEIRAVGSDTTRTIDVRIIAATHQPLEERVKDEQFRRDLFFRLNVLPVEVPPLRDRREDIPLLIDHFLEKYRRENRHSPVKRLAPGLVDQLTSQEWPGNVRELENLVRRIVALTDEEVVTLSDYERVADSNVGDMFDVRRTGDTPPTLRDLENEYIKWVIERCDGNKSAAADVLDIDVSTIHRREKTWSQNA